MGTYLGAEILQCLLIDAGGDLVMPQNFHNGGNGWGARRGPGFGDELQRGGQQIIAQMDEKHDTFHCFRLRERFVFACGPVP
jgi:hypothetical protein